MQLLLHPLAFLSFAFSLIEFAKFPASTLAFTNETDRQALLAIRNRITTDPSGFFYSWNASFHFCKWPGVACNLHHQRVTALQLYSLKLAGSLSPYIGNLTFIRLIDLGDNSFAGVIPQEIGRLFRLRFLNLSINFFEGDFPTNITHCSKLERINVLSNNLAGKFPAMLGSLPELTQLNLSKNRFTAGTIPPSFGNLSLLDELSLGYNNLKGTIPVELGRLSKLEFLQLTGNKLTGEIPISLYNISAITFFSVRSNLLHGQLPTDIGVKLPNLQQIYLGLNNFSGSFPESLVNASGLKFISISNNAFTGRVPLNLGDLKNLEHLEIGGNFLFDRNGDGDDLGFLISLTNCTNLRVLRATRNGLKGGLPNSITNLSTKLTMLRLDDNQISGTIHPGIENLINLIHLKLNKNMLFGRIPYSIGKLIKLQLLDLSDNSLGKLDISGNGLSAKIPSSLGSCLMLKYLYMRGNRFEGYVPSSFEQLKNIEILDLSRNNLSGQIPQFLGNFSYVSYLNLSFNNFEGEVPDKGMFRNASLFSVTGNPKLCGGTGMLRLSPCSKAESAENKHHITTRAILLIVYGTNLIIILSFCGCAFFCLRKRLKWTHSSGLPVVILPMKLSYAKLFEATDGFLLSNLIGEGSFGYVYRGTLGSEGYFDAAVKVFKLQNRGAMRSFSAECEALRYVRHRNVVKIIASCLRKNLTGYNFIALVYKLMPNGSLDMWLPQSSPHQPRQSSKLDMIQRLNIAIDVACALNYLHHHCHIPVIHCDLKPSNILLDSDLVAYVSDFGLARLLSAANTTVPSESQTSNRVIRGTIGYVPPEYGMSGEASRQGDVYSFGIILLELFTGRKPTDSKFSDNLNLHEYVRRALPHHLLQIVDPQLIREKLTKSTSTHKQATRSANPKKECLMSILGIGLMCSAELPKERPDIRDVLNQLHRIRSSYLVTEEGREVNGRQEELYLSWRSLEILGG